APCARPRHERTRNRRPEIAWRSLPRAATWPGRRRRSGPCPTCGPIKWPRSSSASRMAPTKYRPSSSRRSCSARHRMAAEHAPDSRLADLDVTLEGLTQALHQLGGCMVTLREAIVAQSPTVLLEVTARV